MSQVTPEDLVKSGDLRGAPERPLNVGQLGPWGPFDRGKPCQTIYIISLVFEIMTPGSAARSRKAVRCIALLACTQAWCPPAAAGELYDLGPVMTDPLLFAQTAAQPVWDLAPATARPDRRGSPAGPRVVGAPASGGALETEAIMPANPTKSATILKLLGRPKGASIAQLQKATDWQGERSPS